MEVEQTMYNNKFANLHYSRLWGYILSAGRQGGTDVAHISFVTECKDTKEINIRDMFNIR